MHFIQRLRHYILLICTLVLSYSNPIQHILTQCRIGGKYSKWIFIFQKNYLDFAKSKSKNSLSFFVFLIQEDKSQQENVVYYLGKGLVSLELIYSHVKKVVLVEMHFVQRIRHYILLRCILVLQNSIPREHILTQHIIRGKY